MIPLEVIDALRAAGATSDMILAAIEADQRRLAVRRMVRRALRGLGGESGFRPQEPDSRVRILPIAGDVEGVRSAPEKSMARAGIASSRQLTPAMRLVAARLVEHRNMKTGRCDPSVVRMAHDLGLSDRSVRRAVAQLEDLGLVQRHIHAGRGLSNGYVLDLKAMAALHEPIERKPDSAENRTLVAEKPDRRVRQNGVNKQPLSVNGEASPARADPLQRELPLMRVLPGRQEAAQSSARRRIIGDIAATAATESGFNVSTLTDQDWADADLAEVRRKGGGIGVIRARLSTGPPKATGTG